MDRRIFTAFAFSALALPFAAPARAAEQTPTELVQALYKVQAASDRNPKSPDPDSKAQRGKFFSKRMIALFVLDDRLAAKEGIGRLDFVPYYDGQDYEVTALKVGDAAITGERAVVVARFNNFGKPSEITYDLVRENGAWRVDNIRGEKADPKWDLYSYMTRKS